MAITAIVVPRVLPFWSNSRNAENVKKRWGRSDLNTQPLGIFDRSRIKSSPEGSAYPKHVSGAQRHTGLDYDPTTPSSRQSNIYMYSRSKKRKSISRCPSACTPEGPRKSHTIPRSIQNLQNSSPTQTHKRLIFNLFLSLYD
jgi:hypothetical protein